mmetsp:Transcript_18157/g.29470  ORF Transcript_18157/g.29470 Transcript_18157/m.29470 type:complete len:878 (+) Transcript_18157:307-2940(+)
MSWIDLTSRLLGSRPPPRTYHTCTFVPEENSLYVIGGTDGRRLYGDVHRLNVGNKCWERVSSILCGSRNALTVRARHSAVKIGDNIYIYGGIGGGTCVFAFNVKRSSMTRLKSLGRGPTGRFGHASAAINDSMYIVGGHNGKSYLNDIFRFCVPTKRWYQISVQGPVLLPRSLQLTACSLGGELLVFGGHVGAPMDHVWVLRENSGSGSTYNASSIKGRKSSRWVKVPLGGLDQDNYPAITNSQSVFVCSQSHPGRIALGSNSAQVYLIPGSIGANSRGDPSSYLLSKDSQTICEKGRTIVWTMKLKTDPSGRLERSQVDNACFAWSKVSVCGAAPPTRIGVGSAVVDVSKTACSILFYGGTISGFDMVRSAKSEEESLAKALNEFEGVSTGNISSLQKLTREWNVNDDLELDQEEDTIEDFESEFVLSHSALIQPKRPRDSLISVAIQEKKQEFEDTESSGCDFSRFFSVAVHILDLDATFQWEQLTVSGVAPRPEHGFTMTTLDGRNLLLLGGTDAEMGSTAECTLLRHQGVGNAEWSEAPIEESNHNPSGFLCHTSTYFGGNIRKLYVFGGTDLEVTTDALWILHMLDDRQWYWERALQTGDRHQKRTNWPPGRVLHAACSLGENLHIIGGSADRKLYWDIWVLNVTKGTPQGVEWSQYVQPEDTFKPRFGHSAVALTSNKRIYVFGGCLDSLKLEDVLSEKPTHSFRLSNELVEIDVGNRKYKCSSLNDIVSGTSPGPRYGHSCATVHALGVENICIFGGYGYRVWDDTKHIGKDVGNLRDVHVFNVKMDSWSSPKIENLLTTMPSQVLEFENDEDDEQSLARLHPSFPSARFGQGMSSFRSSIILFGGCSKGTADASMLLTVDLGKPTSSFR